VKLDLLTRLIASSSTFNVLKPDDVSGMFMEGPQVRVCDALLSA
jgi:hypothetical protein